MPNNQPSDIWGWKNIGYCSAVCFITLFQASISYANDQNQVVVAWDDTDGRGFVRALSVVEPWDFTTSALEVGGDGIVRYAFGKVFHVSRSTGTISVIDINNWTIEKTFKLGASSEPRDIAVVSPNLAYVSRSTSTHLLRINLDTEILTNVIDLSLFADNTGIPQMNTMVTHEGLLYVQIRRGFVPDGLPQYIAVIDIAAEQIVDVDPVTPGIQAITLQGNIQRFKMQVVEETNRLFTSATFGWQTPGGLEMVDLNTFQSLGLVIDEWVDNVASDLGAFVMVTPNVGWLTFSTDIVISSHLAHFTLQDRITGGAAEDAIFYFVPRLLHDPNHNLMFFPDPDGIQVLNATTGVTLTPQVLPLSGEPTDLELIRADHSIPAMSFYGLIIVTVILMICGTILIKRNRVQSNN